MKNIFRIRFADFHSDNLKSKIQNLRWGGIVAIGVTFALFGAVAQAQQPKKVPRIGVLFSGTPANFSLRTEAFLQGLRDLGYVEGKTVTIEWRWGKDRVEQLPELAAELVRLNADIIVTNGTTASKALRNATRTIPIVMVVVGDPVGTGLVESLARPGGNATGLSNLTPELSGKRLELLKEVVPTASRVAVLLNPANPTNPIQLRETQAAAPAFGVTLLSLEVKGPDDFERAFTAMRMERAGALIVFGDVMFYSQRSRIVELAVKSRLPGIYVQPEIAAAGGLMSYGPSTNDMFRRAAIYVDKILKGAKPADLPVEQPMKFEFIINLKAAKRIGLTIPQSVLYRADKVIK